MKENKAIGLILELSAETCNRNREVRDRFINDLIVIYNTYNETGDIYEPRGGEIEIGFGFYRFINAYGIEFAISLPNKNDNRMYIKEIGYE